MIHLKTYEKIGDYSSYDEKYEKYATFIHKKFDLDHISYGRVKYIGSGVDNIELSISFNDVDVIFLKSLLDYFDDCEGNIKSNHSGQQIYYRVSIPLSFLEKLDMEINLNKYNL